MPIQDLSELDTEQKKRIDILAKNGKVVEQDTTNLLTEVNKDF